MRMISHLDDITKNVSQVLQTEPVSFNLIKLRNTNGLLKRNEQNMWIPKIFLKCSCLHQLKTSKYVSLLQSRVDKKFPNEYT